MRKLPIRYNTAFRPWVLNLLHRVAKWQGRRHRRDFDQVQRFVSFVGSARSGSTLVGALLDAHPEIVIAHEANAFGCIDAGFDRTSLFWFLLRNSRCFAKSGAEWTGYGYAVPDQWQGRTHYPRVIGDKKAGVATRQVSVDPRLLDRLVETVEVPVSLIHTVRNPFDALATRCRKLPQISLADHADRYFDRCQGVQNLKDRVDAPEMLDVHHEALVSDPERELRRMLDFIGLEGSDDYIAAAKAIVNDKPNRSRHSFPWTPEQIRQIESRMQQYSFLRVYSFEEEHLAAA